MVIYEPYVDAREGEGYSEIRVQIPVRVGPGEFQTFVQTARAPEMPDGMPQPEHEMAAFLMIHSVMGAIFFAEWNDLSSVPDFNRTLTILRVFKFNLW